MSSLEKGVFENFTKFLGKHLSRGLFCNEAAGCRPATSLNRECFRRNENEIASEEIPKSSVISNETDSPDCTSTEPVIGNEEDQLNHLRRKFSKYEAQFAALKSFTMDELLEIKNKTENLISEWHKNCFTNLNDEIKLMKEELLSKNLIIKILAGNTYTSINNIDISPSRNSPLQNVVVNLKKPVKKGNDIDFQISTSDGLINLTVGEPSREEVGQVRQLHTANCQKKKSALPHKNLSRRPPAVINKKPENQHNFQRVKHFAINDSNICHEEFRLRNRRKSKRIKMFSDSIPKRIRIRQLRGINITRRSV